MNVLKKAISISFCVTAVSFCVLTATGQTAKPAATPAAKTTKALATSTDHVRSSAAFAELLLRKTALQADLESLLPDYTEDFPRIKKLRFELGRLQIEIGRLERVVQGDSAKLTLALGKLMLQKVEYETDLWELLNTYNEDHPDAKRAKRKVEIFEAAIADILR